MAKLFRTSVEDSDFRRYEGSLKKIALDSNAVAQESGLATLIQFVENAPDPNRYVRNSAKLREVFKYMYITAESMATRRA